MKKKTPLRDIIIALIVAAVFVTLVVLIASLSDFLR